MKRLTILFGLFLCISSYAQGQVVYLAKQPQKAGTPFVIPFENDETRTGLTPYTLKNSETVTTADGTTYTVNNLRYKGWDEESGDYNVIEIKCGSTTLLSLNYDDGFVYFFCENKNLANNHKSFYQIDMGMGYTALVFTGVAMSSEPPYQTIRRADNKVSDNERRQNIHEHGKTIKQSICIRINDAHVGIIDADKTIQLCTATYTEIHITMKTFGIQE